MNPLVRLLEASVTEASTTATDISAVSQEYEL